MARKIKITSSVLNVRLHPHSPEKYMNFISDLFRLKKPINLRGDRYAIISLLNRSERDRNVITGTITTYTNINPDGPWFDSSGLKEATDEEIAKINIPGHLKPNAASFFLLFDAAKHEMYVQEYSRGKRFSVKSAMTLFRGLASDLNIMGKYGEAKITPVQSRSGLESLLSLDVIKEIRITIFKPNADILADDFEEQIEKHLAETQSKRLTVVYEAEQGASVTPNNDIREMSNVALSNGNVEVRGKDATGAGKWSTEDYPEILRDKYDPDKINEQEAFRRVIAQRQSSG